ncbi:MAG: ABC transporter ATP-binding protein [Planctomycetes bacterium]|nr:ABC transporter ATP-binding protein [Planctomycetota bacterium]
MPPLLVTEGLCYRVGRQPLVVDVALQVHAGEVYGMLGLNGAGKTTTLRLITGLLRPDAGKVHFCGNLVTRAEHRRGLASVVEAPSFIPALGCVDNVLVFARLHGQCAASEARAALTRMGLDATDHRAVRTWSLGMKQRLALAMAMVTRPKLLVLDEPANGLDPAGIVELRGLFPKLAREEGTAVLLSSHLLDEIEQCCSSVGVLRAGRLVLQSPLAKLRERAGWRVRLSDAKLALQRCAAALPGEVLRQDADATVHIARGALPADALLARLVSAGVPVCSFEPASGLEDVLLGRAEVKA